MRFLGPILATLLLPSAASAVAQSPPSIPIIGTVAGTLTRGANWCAVERGTSIFQRAGSGSARIAVPEITYTAVPTTPPATPLYYTLAGRVQLIFSTATTGTAYFDYVTSYPTTISRPTFTGYKQTYSSGSRVLTVTFVLNFPDCSVVVAGVYRS